MDLSSAAATLPNLRELRCPARSRQRLAGKCTNKLGVVFSEGFMCSARRNAHLWPRSTALVAVVSSCERFCRLLHAAPESARRPISPGGRDGVSFSATRPAFCTFARSVPRFAMAMQQTHTTVQCHFQWPTALWKFSSNCHTMPTGQCPGREGGSAWGCHHGRMALQLRMSTCGGPLCTRGS